MRLETRLVEKVDFTGIEIVISVDDLDIPLGYRATDDGGAVDQLLGVEFGVHRTAKVLRLNYDALKARVMVAQAHTPSPESPPRFVEVYAGSAPSARPCVVEFEDGRGARMRMHFEGADATLLGALTSAFMGGRR